MAKANQSNSGTPQRVNFGKIPLTVKAPDLLDIQLQSFKEFFQLDTTSENRTNEGLHSCFSENFPIENTSNQYLLEFLDYFVDPPRYTIEECIERGVSYEVPLKAKLRLSCSDEEHIDFQTVVQDVFLGNIPYLTPKGTFIINGAERVIVSQLLRSPGVYFSQSFHPNGTKLYTAKVTTFKGPWIEFATDTNNVLHAYVERKKKFPITCLLRAIGYESDKDILDLFDLAEEVKVDKKTLEKSIGRKLAARVLRSWREDSVDEDTGELISVQRIEVILERDSVLTEEAVELILEAQAEGADIPTIVLQKQNTELDYSLIFNTLQKDPTNTELEAIHHIFRQIRSTEAQDEEFARSTFEKQFFSTQRYDLGEVGRYKINLKLGITDSDDRVLTKHDIIEIIKYLIRLINQKEEIDDVDHLSNRRVKTVGEQLYSLFGTGLNRMSRTIRDKMNVRDNEVFTPTELINSKALNSVINSFFGSSQLSQFLDQTNPLSEITHKRRISAVGPGGLTRERAGFEVRDVHYSHYGRLCTIETPEGPNIGLISTLCVHAKVNAMGFIETPYRQVKNGVLDLKSDAQFLSAYQEDLKKIAQSNAPFNEKGEFIHDRIKAREHGDFPILEPNDLEFMDVAPNQIVGVSASLIPFLENDDANRALMGSNMQRQAVPLLRPQSPVVGTGLEAKVASDSRMLINAEGKGTVVYVDASEIHIEYERTEDDALVSFQSNLIKYKLTKFRRTNQGSCINLTPLVRKGDKVEPGQVLCEGYATQKGELALGQNLKVAFMPWKGYNFEDAVVLSERIVREDVFTSLHIEEFDLEVRETKLNDEELTHEIPNVSEEATKHLDENGIVKIGTRLKEGDIIIGKVTPKGESDPTPEEKLLRAIFGDKAGDVKDASLRVPPSFKGVVIDTRLFSRRKHVEKKILKEELDALEEQANKDKVILIDLLIEKLMTVLKGKKSAGVMDLYEELRIPEGESFTIKKLKMLDFHSVDFNGWTADEHTNNMVKALLHNFTLEFNKIKAKEKREEVMIRQGDELSAGVLKLAKVYVAKKRKLQVGDKLAGRHGNKGIVSRIVRDEDMPFLEDGTPVDIVLNPLGVPSRMNLGQIYETVLGWAGEKLGVKFATPIFDGASFDEIDSYVEKAGLPKLGQTYLYDGDTGERFDQKTTVGVIYMLKLSHMVDDKMHARSIGPYSLITQQPLGGKAQFGGQRLGEMEVWALEAYGAAHNLQELLTIKSDDVNGRAKAYEAIVKGEPLPNPGIPESFKVLESELKGLGLNIRYEENN